LDAARLAALLGRGFQLSQALERWSSAALWVLTRADVAYPRRLKAHLREDAPPVLYGCGDQALLEAGGLAVVGSRDASEADLDFTAEVGDLAARAGVSIVSGGAKGVDQAAMSASLEAGGTAVGVLADRLERAALSAVNRLALREGRLALVSPFDPQSGFAVWRAMGRNKHIYALSDAALVVASARGKGGTWEGATEELKRANHVRVFARPDSSSPGMLGLLGRGAISWPQPGRTDELKDLLAVASEAPRAEAAEREGLFDQPERPAEPEPVPQDEPVEALSGDRPLEVEPSPDQNAGRESAAAEPAPDVQLLALVTNLILRLATSPVTESSVADALDVSKAQAHSWLRRLAKQGLLDQPGKATFVARQQTLF
ncbi:MAG TPA: DNA-processing protein DprA, partial [Deinococcales bacterium]|nr:DNA-processing protein DprA [Deinococcales bacterium]